MTLQSSGMTVSIRRTHRIDLSQLPLRPQRATTGMVTSAGPAMAGTARGLLARAPFADRCRRRRIKKRACGRHANFHPEIRVIRSRCRSSCCGGQGSCLSAPGKPRFAPCWRRDCHTRASPTGSVSAGTRPSPTAGSSTSGSGSIAVPNCSARCLPIRHRRGRCIKGPISAP